MASFYAVLSPGVRRLVPLVGCLVWGLAGCLVAGCGRPAAESSPSVGDGLRPTAAAADLPTLCRRIDAALAHAREGRRLDASVHGAWQVVHGILAFGDAFPLRHDGTESSALAYLLDGGRLTGWSLRPGAAGIVAVVEEGSTTGQGHPDQWLGYLSQCGRGGIPRDAKLAVGSKSFTVDDLLRQAMADIRPAQEATWTLMALATYLPADASWTASDGTSWTIERVALMEADADVFSAACGGAHRLYGLAVAVEKHRAQAGGADAATDGWTAAEEVLEECIDRARRFQQPDGSFSIHSFERSGTSADVFARLSATGHVFEVLAVALDDERLRAPWVTRAADRLVTLLEQTADIDVECGALYHAAHGLLLYRHRVCGSTD